MESGEIRDEQLSASSSFNQMPVENSRLHYQSRTRDTKSAWGPLHILGEDEWLQIDLLILHTITAVITQGVGDNYRYHWVKTYTLQFASTDSTGNKWLIYRELDGNKKVVESLFIIMPFLNKV